MYWVVIGFRRSAPDLRGKGKPDDLFQKEMRCTMRVGMISTYPPIECGIATYTQYLVDELRKQQADVYIVSHVGGPAARFFQVLITRMPIWQTRLSK